jgi:hypothetical protein
LAPFVLHGSIPSYDVGSMAAARLGADASMTLKACVGILMEAAKRA